MDKKKRVLLVEDDANTQALYSEVLQGAGFEVKLASDGEEGLMNARLGGYDLILLDIMLPKLDGLGVLTGLKDQPPTTKNGPIIVLTNLSDEALNKQAEQLGAKGYLIKSDVHTSELVAKLTSFL
jgi:DNA-binding response OmpR family regulator